MKLGVSTPDGEFVAYYSKRGLKRLNFPAAAKHKSDHGGDKGKISASVRDWHKLTTRAVREILTGRAQGELPPLDLSSGTDFQQSVWNAMRKIGCGQTKSYGEIAAQIKRPKAVRAVGGACGANPIPLIVPCHRVLAANQKLGGFSSGLNWKRKLLAREKVELFD